jgi:predicted transglutaminase-like cysteine proteinase
MTGFHRAHAIACGLVFLLSALPAQSTAADEPNITAATASKPIAAGNPIANIAAPPPTTPKKQFVVALANPAPRSPASALPAPGDLPLPSPAWPAPAKFFTINQVLAKHKLVGSNSSSVHLAAINPTVSDIPMTTIGPLRSDEPFGLFTFRAPDGLLWSKWRKVEADIQAEAPVLARCRAKLDRCRPATARFVAIIKKAAALHGRAKFELVNERVNAVIRYTSDWEQWHEPDVWSAPLDRNNKGSFDTGMGDCEDYAIAKYVALREAGVAPADVRLLLVRDNSVHLDHAVLAARQDGHWLILDNRWSRLTEDTDLKQFEPLFSLNDAGVKLFAAPYTAIEPVSMDDFAAGNPSTSVFAPATNAPISIASLPLLM